MITAAVILTLIYNLALIIKNEGIPPSLSDSFYIFGGKPVGYVMYAYFVAIFGLLIKPMTDAAPENFQFVAFFTLAALVFVGVSADFLSRHERPMHFFCAVFSAVMSITWCLITGNWLVMLLSFAAFGGLALSDKKNKTYWLEMGCFVAILLSLSLMRIYA